VRVMVAVAYKWWLGSPGSGCVIWSFAVGCAATSLAISGLSIGKRTAAAVARLLG
jgi:hypothetical protein